MQTALVVGGTGRTGQRLVRQLLERGVSVRAIVRSRSKLPPEVARHAALTVIEANLLALSDAELEQHVRGCDAVLSCLGHVLSLRGIFGPPRDLVTRATQRLCRAIAATAPAAPVKFILMSSVSVHRPGRLDARRGGAERAVLWVLRGLVPPTRDNQRAADLLGEQLGAGSRFVEWAVVRPDSLLDGDVSPYTLHEGLINGLFSPGKTSMANVAHFMCELVSNPQTWADWKAKLPVIVNQPARP
ncbi:MAG: SDR family oxidoreductase [Deltaproteobacteria bacterium]|nr:SDR family oxidoreductase [Deltaproteobacteria bacterium]